MVAIGSDLHMLFVFCNLSQLHLIMSKFRNYFKFSHFFCLCLWDSLDIKIAETFGTCTCSMSMMTQPWFSILWRYIKHTVNASDWRTDSCTDGRGVFPYPHPQQEKYIFLNYYSREMTYVHLIKLFTILSVCHWAFYNLYHHQHISS